MGDYLNRGFDGIMKLVFQGWKFKCQLGLFYIIRYIIVSNNGYLVVGLELILVVELYFFY